MTLTYSKRTDDVINWSLLYGPILEHIKNKKAAVNTAEKHHIKMSHDFQAAYGILQIDDFSPVIA